MTTSQLIKELNNLAEIGVVNALKDTETLREAAARLYELREKADPKWNSWLIMDDGLFLARMNGEESEWTDVKDEAVIFENEDDANEFADTILGFGFAVLRGDYDPITGAIISFDCE